MIRTWLRIHLLVRNQPGDTIPEVHENAGRNLSTTPSSTCPPRRSEVPVSQGSPSSCFRPVRSAPTGPNEDDDLGRISLCHHLAGDESAWSNPLRNVQKALAPGLSSMNTP